MHTTEGQFYEGTALVTTATIFVAASVTAFVTVSYHRMRPNQPLEIENEKEVAITGEAALESSSSNGIMTPKHRGLLSIILSRKVDCDVG